MDWYSIVKFLHIVCALIWVGGGFTLMLLAARAERAGNIESMLQAMRATGELGNRLFAPLSLATLAFGLVMCGFWAGFSELWIVIGLAGYFVTFSVGMLVFKPTADRMGRMIAKDGLTPAALAQGRRILSAARFDYSVMLVIIADMVLKPTLDDRFVLGGMALVMLGGAALALSNNARGTTPAHA
ncbi:DUF2269 family protein [Mesorhizobium sp. SP-1A]|uniref:DUF2269 family protein n=1 Tax=Mesorhizobium sp. SP-1A TaxID=3077840 RepID=UPI0028F6E2A1|nr:DUF2269 family protein [Mesorhizobium sp. SP-1A]